GEGPAYTRARDAMGTRDRRSAPAARRCRRRRRALLRQARLARLDLRLRRRRLAWRVDPLELRRWAARALRAALDLPWRALRPCRAGRRGRPLSGTRADGARRGARGVRGRPARLARRRPDPERRA